MRGIRQRDKLTSKENAQTPYFDNTYIECFGDSNCEHMIAHADRTVDSAVWDTTDLEPKIKIFAPGETRKHPIRVAASCCRFNPVFARRGRG